MCKNFPKFCKIVSKVDSGDIRKGIIVDRDKFHQALKDEFKSYINKLKTNKPEFDDLRNNCINKMKYICN